VELGRGSVLLVQAHNLH